MGIAVLLAGCYQFRTIIVPPSEHSEFCMNDARHDYNFCQMAQRGTFYCRERYDNALLRCPGAYELLPGDAGAADAGADEYDFTQLPGPFRKRNP